MLIVPLLKCRLNTKGKFAKLQLANSKITVGSALKYIFIWDKSRNLYVR